MSINGFNPQMYQCAFKRKSTTNTAPTNSADELLNESNKQYQKSITPGFKDKVFGLPTLNGLSFIGLGCYLIKLVKGLKNKHVSIKSYFAKIGIAFAAYILTNFLSTTIANKNYDKHFKEQQDYFESVNKTHAKLSDKTIYSSYVAAMYDSSNGKITLNRSSIVDPWQRFKNKYLIKHELVHAKQFEMIARSKNGINRLNYTVLKGYADSYSKNQQVKEYINQVYNDIITDTTHKYDNVILRGENGIEINYRNSIIGAKMLMDNPATDINELPIVIDEEHYQKVIEDMPPLTPEEEIQAEKYYEAKLNYVPLSFWQALNPFGKYRQNLLEKEAYKENPWYTRIL